MDARVYVQSLHRCSFTLWGFGDRPYGGDKTGFLCRVTAASLTPLLHTPLVSAQRVSPANLMVMEHEENVLNTAAEIGGEPV